MPITEQGTRMMMDEIGQAEGEPPAAPILGLAAARQPGALKGQIMIAEDFDTLPDDVLAAMED